MTLVHGYLYVTAVACMSLALSVRVHMQAYGVWWFPGMVLNMGAFLLSLAWGLLIFTLSWLRWRSSHQGTQACLLTPPLHLTCLTTC